MLKAESSLEPPLDLAFFRLSDHFVRVSACRSEYPKFSWVSETHTRPHTRTQVHPRWDRGPRHLRRVEKVKEKISELKRELAELRAKLRKVRGLRFASYCMEV